MIINSKELTMEQYATVLRDKYPSVPDIFIETICMWVFYATPAGSFTNAVLRNDLMGAVGNADRINGMHLHDICSLVYSEVPMQCRGDNCDDWPIKIKALTKDHHGVE